MLEVMVLADYKSLYLKLPDFKSGRTFLAYVAHQIATAQHEKNRLRLEMMFTIRSTMMTKKEVP